MGLDGLGLAFVRTLPLALGAKFASGLGGGLSDSIWPTLIRENVEEDKRGRAFSLFVGVVTIPPAMTVYLGGWLADRTSLPLVYGLAGGWVLVTAIASRFLAGYRAITQSQQAGWYQNLDALFDQPGRLRSRIGRILGWIAIYLGRSILAPILPLLSSELGLTYAQVGLIESAYLVGYIVVKVPAIESGFRAAAELARVGVSCNITLTFQPAQAIPFARIPVAYVSLIIGRKDDFGLDSLEEITRARQMLDRLATPTKLLVASIRNPHHLCAAVTGGADVITVPPSTWKLVYENPLSVQGLEDFGNAWSQLPAKVRAEYERLGRASAA